ncbi:MAG: asparagine synthase (glutamine-hydrolyzing) [Burkholderiales bacterium]|nr:asparagine synthase (glutamine-hydrolyzing) [Burkholderiales bacterium]
MCGIAGLLAFPGAAPPSRDELMGMIGTLRHRGPDGHGVWQQGPVGLAHARLSIIDLAGGTQPMANEDGQVQVTFNGEIFNHVELRERLVARGHVFRTASDTEVLVHLYEDHGPDFVEHLNGQFALALWDARRQRLVLARDRVGIRPLFHARVGGRLAFASEVKALFTLPGMACALDAGGLAETFSYWAVLPPRTVWEGVQAVPPGHRLIFDAADGRERLERYWDWPFDAVPPRWSDERWAEELRERLVDAVRLQLRADVPVGAYLSGGLDSSIITAITAVVRRHTGTPLRTFSLTFAEAEFDESDAQRELVRHLGTQHSSMQARGELIAAAFPRMVRHAEAPLLRTAPAPMMLLADSVRAAGYKVVLTGEGADEAFGGYDLFKEAAVRRFVARQPSSRARPALLSRLYPYLSHSPMAGRAMTQAYFGAGREHGAEPHFAHTMRAAATRRALAFFHPDWRARIAAHSPEDVLARAVSPRFAQWPALARDQYVEANTLMSGYLLSSQGDRAAMAASVEARYPFLDHRLLEFSCRMPARLKLCGLHEKVLLRRAFKADLPASIAARVKQPYRAPDSASFFERPRHGADGPPRLREETAELLDPARLRDAGLFDAASVARLVEKCRSGRAIGFADNMAFVGIVSCMWLHRQFIRPI